METTHGNSINNDDNLGSDTDREGGAAEGSNPQPQNPPRVIQLNPYRHNDRDNLEVDLNHVPRILDTLPPLSDHPFTPTPNLTAAIERLRTDKEMLKEAARMHNQVISALRDIPPEERTLRKEVEAIIKVLRSLWFQTWKKRGSHAQGRCDPAKDRYGFHYVEIMFDYFMEQATSITGRRFTTAEATSIRAVERKVAGMPGDMGAFEQYKKFRSEFLKRFDKRAGFDPKYNESCNHWW